jgi:hypothetical protein
MLVKMQRKNFYTWLIGVQISIAITKKSIVVPQKIISNPTTEYICKGEEVIKEISAHMVSEN